MKKSENLKENQKNQRIQVFARCRPINNFEKKQFSPCVVEVNPERKEVKVRDERMMQKSFAFDKVFGPDTKQISVYKAVVEPLIREVLMGYNCTVFAYGQTGTGKTFTMEGERSIESCSWEEDPSAGIIPRSLHQLFEELTKEENVEFSVHVSFLELYNEELFDLLSRNDISKLRLFEDSSRKGSVVIQGLEEIKVNTKDEVYLILEQGTSRRQKAATLLNATSSRSHTVFSVTVHIKENTIDGEELLKTGKLNLVDLAGSENIGRSGASQKTAREAGNINQSLLTLGRVITALVEKAPHIPYRESKLTRLLQDSLGGHTKTSIIATVSPALCNVDETISTLDYAQRAKSITIKPEVNQKMTKKALIKEYTEEIERLRKDLVAMRDHTGFFIDQENYNNMQQEIVSKSEKIAELESMIETLEAKVEKIGELFMESQDKEKETRQALDSVSKLCQVTAEKLSNTTNELQCTKTILDETILDRNEKEYVTEVQGKTGKELLGQAQALLQVAEESSSHVSALHSKIERKQNVENSNEEHSQQFRLQFQKELADLDDELQSLSVEQIGMLQYLQKSVAKTSNLWNFHSESDISSLHKFLKSYQEHMHIHSDQLTLMSNEHDRFSSSFILEMERDKVEYKDQQKNLLNSVLTSLHEFMQKQTALQDHLQSKLEEMSAKIELQKMTLSNAVASQRSKLRSLNELFQTFISAEAYGIKKKVDEYRESILHKRNTYKQKCGKQVADIMQLFKSLMTTFEEEDQAISEDSSQMGSCAQAFMENFEATAFQFERQVNQMQEEETFQAHIHGFLDDVKLFNCTNMEKEKEMLSSMMSNREEIKNKLVDCCNQSETLLETKVNYFKDALKSEQKQVSDSFTNCLDKLKQQESKLCDAITVHERQIQADGEKVRTLIGELESTITKGRQQLSTKTDAVKRKLLARDIDVEKFVSEVLVKDIPTGTTPQRKEYIFPRSLARVISPDKILEELRAQRKAEDLGALNAPLNSSLEESPSETTPKKVAIHDLPKETITASMSSDSCNESDSSLSACSDASSKNGNKENNPATHMMSNIPKRVPEKKKKRMTKKKGPLNPQYLAPPSRFPLLPFNE